MAERALGGLAALVLMALMLLTCVDVAGRYFLNRPVTGGLEVTEILLALVIFAGVPLVTKGGSSGAPELLAQIVRTLARGGR